MEQQKAPEFTHKQGLAVGLSTLIFGAALLLLGGDRWFDVGIIAFTAIAATIFIQRRLLRRFWFMLFLVVMVLMHLALVLAFPINLDRSGFKLLAVADFVCVLGLALGLERLMARWN